MAEPNNSLQSLTHNIYNLPTTPQPSSVLVCPPRENMIKKIRGNIQTKNEEIRYRKKGEFHLACLHTRLGSHDQSLDMEFLAIVTYNYILSIQEENNPIHLCPKGISFPQYSAQLQCSHSPVIYCSILATTDRNNPTSGLTTDWANWPGREGKMVGNSGIRNQSLPMAHCPLAADPTKNRLLLPQY